MQSKHFSYDLPVVPEAPECSVHAVYYKGKTASLSIDCTSNSLFIYTPLKTLAQIPFDLILAFNTNHTSDGHTRDGITIHAAIEERNSKASTPLLKAKDYFVYPALGIPTQDLVTHLEDATRDAFDHRAKRIRVYLNPYGGKKLALKSLNEVMPLFKLAGVELDVTHTTHAGHALELCQTDNLQDYDALLIVSGDGMVNEVLNGIMRRADGHKPCIGLLPAGSTNTVVWSIMGHQHLTTCALRVIFGSEIQMDIGKACTPNGEPKFFSNMVAYGFFGDVIKLSEGHRALGPARYKLAGAVNVLKSRSYTASIKLRGTNSNEENSNNLFSKERTPTKTVALNETKKYKSINVCLVRCSTNDCKQGLAPDAKLGDGRIHLVLVEKCSRVKFLKFLINMMKGSHYGMDNVENIVCKEAVLTPATALKTKRALSFGKQSGKQSPPPGSPRARRSHSWSVDGELLDGASLSISVIPRALHMFGSPTKT